MKKETHLVYANTIPYPSNIKFKHSLNKLKFRNTHVFKMR